MEGASQRRAGVLALLTRLLERSEVDLLGGQA